jgi:hypothetical protein
MAAVVIGLAMHPCGPLIADDSDAAERKVQADQSKVKDDRARIEQDQAKVDGDQVAVAAALVQLSLDAKKGDEEAVKRGMGRLRRPDKAPRGPGAAQGGRGRAGRCPGTIAAGRASRSV